MQIKLHIAEVLGILLYCVCIAPPANLAQGTDKASGYTQQSSANSNTVTSTPPNITYTCLGNGHFNLILPMVSPFSSYIITHRDTISGPMYNENNQDLCTKPLTTWDKQKNTTVTLSNCDGHVYLYAMKNRKVVGGAYFHKYNLTCLLPDRGVTVAVKQNFMNIKPTPKSQNENPQLTLTLKFMKTDLTEKSTFKIGEGFKLDIHDNSAVAHKLILKNCTSYSDQAYTQDGVALYDRDGNTKEDEIFDKINETAVGDIFVDLHAFRYPTSNTVFMECTVYVCNKDDDNCGTKAGSTRRRRSTDNSVHAVHGSFSVIDTSESSKPKSSGQGTVAPSSMSVMSSVICVTTYLIMKSN